jgi:acyl-CoA dehydrogenase
VLVTARRDEDSASSDQVLAFCLAEHTRLTETTPWDALGLRGTCSAGFALEATGELDHILPDPFADVAAQTMLPVSHVLWGFVWLGLAGSAVTKARSFIQAEARKKPGTPPLGTTSFAELMVVWNQMESLIRTHATDYDSVWRHQAAEPGMGETISSNSLKVAASRLVVDVVGRSLTICGIAGYREHSPFCLGRQLRDAHGAAVMVNNDRIIGDNAQLLLVHKGES